MNFSIVIAVYNKSFDIIIRTLLSIYSQDYPLDKYEIIFVNDGDEKKDYESILNEFKNKGVNIKYFYLDNPGLGSPVLALNFGIKQSSGSYIIINGADIIHLTPALWQFDEMFIKSKTYVDKYRHCDIYGDIENVHTNIGYNEGIVYNDQSLELDLAVATIYRAVNKNYLEVLDNSIVVNRDNGLINVIDKKAGFFNELIGKNKRFGYPFLVAFDVGLFEEMNGFNERMYRVGWDDYEWWIRCLSFAKMIMCNHIVGVHQWHPFNTHDKDGDKDLNAFAGKNLSSNYFDRRLIRPAANIDLEWGTGKRPIICNTAEEVISKKFYGLKEDKL